MNNSIQQFYQNQGYPYYISDILNWSNEKWESTHDFIQWIFPTTSPSKYNLSAPLLNRGAAKFLVGYVNTILKLVNKFKEFIIETNALSQFNHNFLRASRAIQFLKEVGMEDESESFLNFAEIQAGNNKFWRDALLSPSIL